MSDFSAAISIICKYQGFSEKAYPDPATGKEPYTIGYGSQFYPDGSPVKRGQCCSKHKALEYLFHEISIIETELLKLNLGLDNCMKQALISFIQSIGWESFLYTGIIDAIEHEDFGTCVEEMGRWIFDGNHQVVGGLLDRRREEIALFLQELEINPWSSTAVLLTAFRNYTAAPHQVKAIRALEEKINPYILSEFANSFEINENPWMWDSAEDADLVFNG